jgi:hypothetical protein
VDVTGVDLEFSDISDAWRARPQREKRIEKDESAK